MQRQEEVQVMSGIEVVRIEKEGQTYIQKLVRGRNEAHILVELEKIQFPAPRLLEERQLVGDEWQLLLSNIEGSHLETKPEAYPQAMKLIERCWDLELSSILPSITSQSIYYQLIEGPSFKEVCSTLLWSEDRVEPFVKWSEYLLAKVPALETLVFSHGDYHPRNILVTNEGIVPIDWEKAGYHSIYQDLYALIGMSYPDADASLIPSVQKRMLHAFHHPKLTLNWMNDYLHFVKLNRLLEITSIAKDILLQNRDQDRLLLQAETIWNQIRSFMQEGEVVR
jgi:tRNA A-37 threonylcarbamoyl transferase component Bud32